MSATDTQERDEQLSLMRDSAADFVKGNTDHKRTRALRNQLPGFDPKLAKQMAEMGWNGVLIPEAFGGLGLGFAEMGAVLTELGRGLMAEPLAATVVLGARALLHGDNEKLKAQLLPQIAEGKAAVALAWQDDNGMLDPALTTATAVPAGGTVKITGRKRFVSGAANATGFLVTARSDQGVGLYWVPAKAAGLTVEHEWHADGTPAGVVKLMETPAEAVAASPAVAVAGLNRAIDEAAVMASAELFGVVAETFRRTVEYLCTRVQFDKPIGSFQALQHISVDLYILQEICESVLGDAVRALDDPDTAVMDRARVTSRVKARLSEGALRMTREAIQLHGAIAVTDDFDIGLYFKRAITLAAWLGNADAHRRRFIALGATN